MTQAPEHDAGVFFEIRTPHGSVTLWLQADGLWWCDAEVGSHTPACLPEAVAYALRCVGINKDHIHMYKQEFK